MWLEPKKKENNKFNFYFLIIRSNKIYKKTKKVGNREGARARARERERGRSLSREKKLLNISFIIVLQDLFLTA